MNETLQFASDAFIDGATPVREGLDYAPNHFLNEVPSMEGLIEQLPEPLRESWALVLAGGLLLFLGWGIYRLSLRLFGFALGAVIGGLLAYVTLFVLAQTGVQDYQEHAPIIIGVAALFLGVINLFMIMKVYYLMVAIGLALLGASAHGALNRMEVFQALPENWAGFMEGNVGMLIMGILFAVIGLLLHRYAIIFLTVYFGAALVYTGLPEDYRFEYLIPTLMAIGLLVQIGFVRWLKIRTDTFRRARVRRRA